MGEVPSKSPSPCGSCPGPTPTLPQSPRGRGCWSKRGHPAGARTAPPRRRGLVRPPPRDSTIVHCCPGPTTLFPRLEHQGAAPSGTVGPGVEAAAGRSCPKTLSLAWQACHSLISKPCPLHPQEHCGAHVSRLRTGKRGCGCAALGPGPARQAHCSGRRGVGGVPKVSGLRSSSRSLASLPRGQPQT